MENLPVFIPIIFASITAFVTWMLYKATSNSKVVVLALIWLGGQGILGVTDFYTVTYTLPPRMLLLVLPPLVLIAVLFVTRQGRVFIDSLHTGFLTLLHLARIPVELVLFWLFVHGNVPELMTFEGRNLDILAGLSAPIIYYFGFLRHRFPASVIIGWNIICLGLLVNIVIHGILSVPTPFQQFGFEQPNTALLYFPFIWLPGYIVPVVLFSHLATIRQMLYHKLNVAGRGVHESVNYL
ncbi:hypothetical protein [Pontibacter kalidii]|uniref:hypothetical protein n=1 Tax=Pontibacter kalidii TaxID=2592049 RepID=UPI0022502622|nr:hypothetical protein [Pontibacter kalidii]